MSTITPTFDPASAAMIVSQCRQSLQSGKERVVKILSFVPDDKLNWSPSPTSKSALRLAAHTAVGNYGFITILSGGQMPVGSFEELLAIMDAEERKLTSRDQVAQALEDSCRKLDSVLASMTTEQVNGQTNTGFFSGPTSFFMGLPGMHMLNHAAQIDYLQTIWGDLDPHFEM